MPSVVFDEVETQPERALMIRGEQHIGRYMQAGLRYNHYSPNTTVKNNQRDQYEVGFAVHPTKGLKVELEYALAIDNARPEGKPAPSKHISVISLWSQVRF